MNADELIESYVVEVASLLSRKQRRDVGTELRLLLNEELQAKAATAQRPIDVSMTLELLHAFGRPAEVAARYRPPLTVIDPVDGRRFLYVSAIGVAIIWIYGVLVQIRELQVESELLTLLGRWWIGFGLAAFWWPGFLVVCFGLTAWSRRRWPQISEWKPRSIDRNRVNRLAMISGLVAISCGLFIILDPRRLLDILFDGRAAPTAYEAFTYTEAFRHGPAPWLLLFLVLNIAPQIFAIVRGRWSLTARRLDIALSIIICALLVWTVLGGNMFVADASDKFAKACLVLIVVVSLVSIGFKLYRSVRLDILPDDLIKSSSL